MEDLFSAILCFMSLIVSVAALVIVEIKNRKRN
jgi:hypothetical protein